AIVGEAGKQPGFRIERRGLDLAWARQRGEDNFAHFGQRARRLADGGALLPQGFGRLAPEVVNGQPMPGRDEAAGDRRPHRAGADKPDAHRSLPRAISGSERSDAWAASSVGRSAAASLAMFRVPPNRE